MNTDDREDPAKTNLQENRFLSFHKQIENFCENKKIEKSLHLPVPPTDCLE